MLSRLGELLDGDRQAQASHRRLTAAAGATAHVGAAYKQFLGLAARRSQIGGEHMGGATQQTSTGELQPVGTAN